MDYPERLQIETYHGCNARCTMCSVLDWRRPHGEMPDEVFQRTIEQARAFLPQLEVVSLIMDGEALLGRKIVERVRACKSVGLPKIGFASNGSLLTADLGRKLLAAGLDWISFSFDTLDKEMYEKARVGLTFEVTLANIHAFIKARDEGGYKTRINLRYLDHAKDYTVFEKYKEYWGGYLGSKDQIHYGRVYNWYPDKNDDKRVISCSYAMRNIVVLRDGTVPLCCRDFDAKFVFGNVMESSLMDIWNSQEWRKVREIHRVSKGAGMEMCRGCDLPEYEKERKGHQDPDCIHQSLH